jgi:hypothetical protein
MRDGAVAMKTPLAGAARDRGEDSRVIPATDLEHARSVLRKAKPTDDGKGDETD